MINYDMHIHCEYCGHAPGMTIPAILTQADEIGLETIALTCHVFSHADLELINEIREEVSGIRKKCRVIIGAEIDVDGTRCDGRLVTEEYDKTDYIVAGFHYIPGSGNYPRSPKDCTLEPGQLFDRWKSTLLGVVSNENLHTLAHPGRMIGTAIDLEIFWDDVLAAFAQAAKISFKNNIAWELNELTGSKIDERFHKRWYRIYQVALDAGIKLIYGSDAHDLASIGKTDFTRTILSKIAANSLAEPACVIGTKS